MAVKIRMTRKGSKHNPFYRIVVADERSPRDGRYIELVGTYNPCENPAKVDLKMDRIEHWQNHGVKMTQTVSQIIKRHKQGAQK
jgi:small subunit ribosomal protein S16